MELVDDLGGLLLSWLSLLTAFLAGFGLCLYLWLQSPKRPHGAPPGPSSVPILGSDPFIELDKPYHLLFQKLAKKYGNIFSFYHGSKFTVVLNDYESIKEAFQTRGRFFGGRPADPRHAFKHDDTHAEKGLSDSNYSDEWKLQRGTVRQVLKELVTSAPSADGRIDEQCDEMIDRLKDTEGNPYDPTLLIRNCVAKVLCSLILGETYKRKDPKLQDCIEAVYMQRTGMKSDIEAVYRPLYFLRPSYHQSVNLVKRSAAMLRDFYMRHIQKAIVRFEEYGKEPNDFVALYMRELNEPSTQSMHINEDWVFSIVPDLFFSGIDGVSITLSWAFLYMAKYPEVQKKCQEEMDRVLGRSPHHFILEERDKLPYTDATIMETQRLASVSPVGKVHVTMDDIEFMGFKIPKGTEVMANLYNVLRDSKVWYDAQKLRPDRFFSKDGKLIKLEAWIPFSTGRRVCVGEHLAQHELFLFFAHVLHRFEITTPEGAPGVDDVGSWEQFTLRPKAHEFCFTPRI